LLSESTTKKYILTTRLEAVPRFFTILRLGIVETSAPLLTPGNEPVPVLPEKVSAKRD